MQARWTKDLFLAELSIASRQAIEQTFHLTPSEFWHAARGARGERLLMHLPAERQRTLSLDLSDDCLDARPLGPPAILDDFAEVVRRRSRKPADERQVRFDFGD
jgi:hypothetical protein